MLNFIYWPVSAILWFWHKAFGYVLGVDNGAAWALSVTFLVFTLRAILYKPFVHQVRSMRKMQEFSPEIKKLQKKYAGNKQKLAEEMQKLQKEHGVSPLGGCLPMLVQVPVFIGLFHVLKGFNPHFPNNYIFTRTDIESFNRAHVFGAKLGAALIPYGQGSLPLAEYNTTVSQMLIVMIPLMIAAGFFTHLTARHNVARQTAVQEANPQTAMMNKLTLYVMPIGVVIGAPFLPLAILMYWVSNNLWTLGQQHLVYKKIDEEEAEKATKKTEVARTLAPKVGQKPIVENKKKPGAKPITPSKRPAGTEGKPEQKPAENAADASSAEDKPAAQPGTDTNGSAPQSNGSTSTNGAGNRRNVQSGGAGNRGRKRQR
ncbi:membrane protein insertase YidC [Pseudonocardia spinosispora]|uniref:membrane protein insertase YidC n=1 Tax=Pseudonocardia spinosispora TaxID=103441 RepID=UPI0003FA4028|nr:membrane protein insertase YidC [Pseudonocardia spinosispora]